MLSILPSSWNEVLADELHKPYLSELTRFLQHERRTQQVYPPPDEIFNAFALTPYQSVKVLILGQDPYHAPDQAHGLAFSVRPGIKPPPSLVNILKELRQDLDVDTPASMGCLTSWAEQGVLLLNTVLTVRAGHPMSHRNRGWEIFTDAVIRALNRRERPLVFVLWGGHAQKKLSLIDPRHRVITSAHPSPLSASTGFFGSRPFSRINTALAELGEEPIRWNLCAQPLKAV